MPIFAWALILRHRFLFYYIYRQYTDMHFPKTLTVLLCSTLLATASFAQSGSGDSTDNEDSEQVEIAVGTTDGSATPPPTRRWYLSNSFDGAILSTAIFEKPGQRRELTTPRFSLIGFGYHFNYDFDEHFGIFTGLGIKNIGFIEKIGDSTIKRRVYTLGAPLGFKLGNLAKRHYGFVGGGFDMPFNYREKGFVKRDDKEKFSEWFSDRTPEFMPFVFAGAAFGSGTTLKLQYYPGNFFNQEYKEESNGDVRYPYRGYTAHLLYITIGLDLHYKKHQAKSSNAATDDSGVTVQEM
jgi:hypothetical protein